MEQGNFRKVVAVNSKTAFNFFNAKLEEFVPDPKRQPERLYVASVLTGFAHLPAHSPIETQDPVVLSAFFEKDIPTLDEENLAMLYYETSASQLLFFAGYYRNQLIQKRLCKIEVYDDLGQMFYQRASDLAEDPRKKEILFRMAEFLPFWNKTCMLLNFRLQENRYLIRPN